MAAKNSATQKDRTDGRRKMLIALKTDLIKDLKKQALDENRNAYEVVEDAVASYLAEKRKRK
jgi:hypothetical protein